MVDSNNGSKNGVAVVYKKEAFRYFKNAQETIRKSPILRGKFYQDTKYVKEASGILWIAILRAVRIHLLKCGVHEKSLPKTYEAYSAMLKKHGTHNGKLVTIFEDLYQIVHLNCYYGDSNIVEVAKEGFQKARLLIEKLTGEKI